MSVLGFNVGRLLSNRQCRHMYVSMYVILLTTASAISTVHFKQYSNNITMDTFIQYKSRKYVHQGYNRKWGINYKVIFKLIRKSLSWSIVGSVRCRVSNHLHIIPVLNAWAAQA